MSRSRLNLSLVRIICGKQCIVFSPWPLALTNNILFKSFDNAKQLFFFNPAIIIFSRENKTKVMVVLSHTKWVKLNKKMQEL